MRSLGRLRRRGGRASPHDKDRVFEAIREDRNAVDGEGVEHDIDISRARANVDTGRESLIGHREGTKKGQKRRKKP